MFSLFNNLTIEVLVVMWGGGGWEGSLVDLLIALIKDLYAHG